ncbi:Signal transduction histidine kinase [Paenibacillus tianmuensis]|uniref:histidine kinase n=1 Tax=Paenibacillus tianmuensis TaxID=624147 RepID=A0A1G4T7F1_9BACL|nr:HAMP domain-containing sensor histidine kinase [Paenibacillus tianmuensis]SCW77288.1 Signal transduction histidine kinase [Paenibacillus tianmuensis]
MEVQHRGKRVLGRGWRFLKSLFGICLLLLFSTASWSAAYFFIHYLLEAVGRQPSDYVGQLFTQLVAFVTSMGIMGTIGVIFRDKHMERFRPVIDAMQRIAKGDFTVKIPPNERVTDQFGELVESINHMAVELNQMEKMRQEFISNVSHEIQSPLTSIGGFARILQSDELSREERMHYLGIIEKESARLSKLSENLLKLTSLESDHHPFERRRYRLDKQLRSLILASEPQWQDKGIDMDVSLEDVNIEADEDLLSQVWVNLLHNSIKFTPAGGTIGVQLKRNGQQAVIFISDTGIGISEDEVAHIFERFYKADKSRNRSTGGSGLGLAIVKRIVEMHTGSVAVQSVPGQGTTFTVRLPALP